MVIPALTRAQLGGAAPGGPTALTIGVLDGVHRGHQALVSAVRDAGVTAGLIPGVVTLHPHPITVLRPEIAPSYLTSLEERLSLLHEAGASWVVPLTFTSDLAEITLEELTEAFYELLGMRLLVLGPDAAYGRGAPKDSLERARLLGAQLGFEVVQVPPLTDASGQRISSTAVRRALADGAMERVTALLGRPYRLAGPVVRGFERGRTIGFPTANISVAADRALPALGVYATRATVAGQTFLGATNIGRRPTFEAGHVSIETYLLDFDGDIYGERMTLDLHHRIRGEEKFSSVDALVAQIGADVAAVRTALG